MAPGAKDSTPSSFSLSIEYGLMVMPLRLREIGTSYASGSLTRLSFRVEGSHHCKPSVSEVINSSPLRLISSSTSLSVSGVSGDHFVSQVQWSCLCGH